MVYKNSKNGQSTFSNDRTLPFYSFCELISYLVMVEMNSRKM